MQEISQKSADNKIWIGNDHGGYELKQHIIKNLKNVGIKIKDVGAHSTEIVRYPYYASKVAEAISKGLAKRGILICSTGIGMSIIANKYKGVRASLCTSTYMGRLTRAHNDSNLLCLGGKITGVYEALDILDKWLTTPYEGCRHDLSIGLIKGAEEILLSGDYWQPEYDDK